MSRILSYTNIPPEDRYILNNRLSDRASKYIKETNRNYDRMKLCPLLGRLATFGPDQLIDFLNPKPERRFKSRLHPTWTGILLNSSGVTDGIVALRKEATIELRSGVKKTEVPCTMLDAISFSGRGSDLRELVNTGIIMGRMHSDLPVVSVEKIDTLEYTRRNRFMRSRLKKPEQVPDLSHEEISMATVLGHKVFTGFVKRDDMNGMFQAAEFGAVYADVPRVIDLTTIDML